MLEKRMVKVEKRRRRISIGRELWRCEKEMNGRIIMNMVMVMILFLCGKNEGGVREMK